MSLMKQGFSNRFLVATLALPLASLTVGAAQSDSWWWDNLAGPDSSYFVNADQIKKNNVNQLDVAWTYPYAASGFNPIVVDDVVYTAGRNGSLIALDATTGKETLDPRRAERHDGPRHQLLAERGWQRQSG